MKTRPTLTVLAILMAITAALATVSEETMDHETPGFIPDINPAMPGNQNDCRICFLVELDPCDGPSTNPQCHVTCTGFGSTQFSAFFDDNGTSCANPRFRRN